MTDTSHTRVAIDVGYGHVKLATLSEDGETLNLIQFPSAILPKYLFQVGVWRPKPLRLVETACDGNYWFTGEDIFEAQDSGIETPAMSKYFCTSELYKKLVQAALTRQSQDVIDTLVLSLPLITYYDFSPLLKSRFVGEIQISDDRRVFVRSVEVRPQGVSAAQATVDTSENPNVVGFDFGCFSLDIFELANGEFINDRCESKAIGMNSIVTEIVSSLSLSSTVSPLDEDTVNKIRKILVTGESGYLGTKLMTFEQLLRLSTYRLNDLKALLETKCREGVTIIPVGGGSRIVEFAIRHRASQILRIDNPSMANVIGMISHG
jgi:hypothetical protein